MACNNKFSYLQDFHQVLASFLENKDAQTARKMQTSSQDVRCHIFL